MNISSIVVKTSENRFESIVNELQQADFCEVHAYEDQKIIVTIEGDGIDAEIVKLRKIESIQGVGSAEMVYAYSEDELNAERDKIETAQSVPDWLNDDSIKAEQIKYKGDLRKKI